MGFDEAGGCFDFRQKFRAESRRCRFIKLHRLLEFQLRWRKEARLHFRKVFFKSPKTSSADRALSLPPSKASMRRSDSAAQAASRALSSGWESESHNKSINLARSWGGKPSISFWMAATLMASLSRTLNLFSSGDFDSKFFGGSGICRGSAASKHLDFSRQPLLLTAWNCHR